MAGTLKIKRQLRKVPFFGPIFYSRQLFFFFFSFLTFYFSKGVSIFSVHDYYLNRAESEVCLEWCRIQACILFPEENKKEERD